MPKEKQKPTMSDYTWEELLSFDRMKRAVMERVQGRVEQAEREGTPLPMSRISELIKEEWLRAKEAARMSPAARQAAREYLQRAAGDIVDNLIRADRAELEAMGVVEKPI